MSDLSYNEKKYLESFLEMGEGYILDFSNAKLKTFVFEAIGINIYSDKYLFKGTSKANRMRAFWEIESNYVVSKLIEELLEYQLLQINLNESKYKEMTKTIYNKCSEIAERLKSGQLVESIDSIKSYSKEKTYEILELSIKSSIKNNQPEDAIDRLHTFVVKYFRDLNLKHKINFEQNTPLHSLFGQYVKFLDNNGIIESEMTRRILKYSISIMESFNYVRNNMSLAHDNMIINYDESVLILNNISNLIKFIEKIESNS